MKKRQMLKNKMMLGALTMEDLCKVSLLEGEFTFGNHWLPIGGTRRRNREIQFWMEDDSWVDFSVPVETVVKVIGNTVRIPMERHNIRGGHDNREIVIRLDRDPFAED